MEAKYNKIGGNYNLTRKADPYLTEQMVFHLQPSKKGQYLDIGCGTGNYTSALQQMGYDFTGVDPSELMLEKAKLNNKTVHWKVGSAEHIGFPENSFDGVIGCLTMHHWSDLSLAFSDIQRILKPNGRIVIFTSTPEQMEGYWLNHYFPKMLSDSISQMPTLDSVKNAMNTKGISFLKTHKYFIKPDLQDHFLYCGKHNPELYFNPNIRHGISSFSSLANKEEVEYGLLELRKDIDSGKHKDIIKSYSSDIGDYLYIIAKKS